MPYKNGGMRPVDRIAGRSTILFLGSGGARFVVARQLRSSAGMWMRFGDTQIHVDPGPGALVRALSHVPPCNPRELDGIVLSHKHLDHSGDVNAVIEAMTSGGFRPRGQVLAPHDAFENGPVVLPYAQRYTDAVVRLDASSGPYQVGDVALRTTRAHHHAVQTYGLLLAYDNLRVAYLPCGRYFDELADDYAAFAPHVLVTNVLFYRNVPNVDHLSWEGAREVIEAVRPQVAVFQHFGTKMLEAQPRRLAQELEDELGIRAIAAYDGLTLDLETEVAAVVD
ncbi:MAG TPA: MBL fold metallo-hydrolase [Candidatus Tumulicola sp.]|jgi:phosphoribosyl 1,2-cyclic phosphodiesterase